MGLDLWFREDVARILASTQETMQASQAAGGKNPAYQQGFLDALQALAVAFGVSAPSGAGSNSSRPRVEVLDPPAWHRGEVTIYDNRQ